MDTFLIILQGAVVIGAILLGVRTGGIGLGLWGLVGLAVLVFVFELPPGDPPTSSMFIILTVITAASTMQSVGGIDYLVDVAKKTPQEEPGLYHAHRAARGVRLHAGSRNGIHLLPADPGHLSPSPTPTAFGPSARWRWPARRRSSPSPQAR